MLKQLQEAFFPFRRRSSVHARVGEAVEIHMSGSSLREVRGTVCGRYSEQGHNLVTFSR